jgi:iron complex outermembrane recepter protein
MKHFVPLLLFILSVSTLKGQSCVYTIEGRVLDLHDNTPIFGAVVSIQGTDLFGQTDEEGYFLIKDICEGSILILVTHVECDTISRRVVVQSNKELKFEMEHHINELQEIVLLENGITQVNASVQESRLNADQLTLLSNQSLAETLSSLSGVSSLKTGNAIAKPMIHGLYGSHHREWDAITRPRMGSRPRP